MKILDRYTLRAYLAPLVWCLGVFIGLYLVLDLLGHLDEILRNHVPLRLLAAYYGTMVPLVFVQVAPFACLMAALYTLSQFNRHQEIMAMRAAGINPWSIARPLVWMGLFLSLTVLVLNETVAPRAALITYQIKQNNLERNPDPRKPHRVQKMIQHLAFYGQGHTMLHAVTFDPVDKKLEGVTILQHARNGRLLRRVTAESAVWTGSAWRFVDGTILHFSAQGWAIGRPIPFTAKVLEAGDRPEVLEKAQYQASFMNTRDLFHYTLQLGGVSHSTTRKLWVELFAKPAAAFSCLVLTLIGIPFAIQPVRGGALLGLSTGLGLGLVYFGVNALLLALGKGEWWLPPIVAAWGAPVGFAWYGIRKAWERLA